MLHLALGTSVSDTASGLCILLTGAFEKGDDQKRKKEPLKDEVTQGHLPVHRKTMSEIAGPGHLQALWLPVGAACLYASVEVVHGSLAMMALFTMSSFLGPFCP